MIYKLVSGLQEMDIICLCVVTKKKKIFVSLQIIFPQITPFVMILLNPSIYQKLWHDNLFILFVYIL